MSGTTRHYSVLRHWLVLLLIGSMLSSCVFNAQPRVERYIIYQTPAEESLSAIAKKFGIPLAQLAAYNALAPSATVAPRTAIKIPWKKPTKGSPKSPQESAVDGKSQKAVRLHEQAARYIGEMAWPTAAGTLESPFGERGGSFHEGIDISAKTGTQIYAAHSGVIVHSSNKLRGYGNLLVIRTEGMISVYAHCDVLLKRVGDKVAKGDLVARVGATGRATGPHLHFETRILNKDKKYQAVDPMVFYAPKQRQK